MKNLSLKTKYYDATEIIIDSVQAGFKEIAVVGNVEMLYSKPFYSQGKEFAVKLYHYVVPQNGDKIIFDCRMPLGNGLFISYSIEDPESFELVEARFQSFLDEFAERSPILYTLQ